MSIVDRFHRVRHAQEDDRSAEALPTTLVESCRDLFGLDGAGIDVVGISPDKPEKLAKFRDAQQLTFPLLSDPSRSALEAYGAYGEKTLYGKKIVGVIRSTFVVGADGRIEQALYNVKATGHVAALRKKLSV